jgi:hypothetical protein
MLWHILQVSLGGEGVDVLWRRAACVGEHQRDQERANPASTCEPDVSALSALGGEAYFALAMERRLWRGLRSFPRRLL